MSDLLFVVLGAIVVIGGRDAVLVSFSGGPIERAALFLGVENEKVITLLARARGVH